MYDLMMTDGAATLAFAKRKSARYHLRRFSSLITGSKAQMLDSLMQDLDVLPESGKINDSLSVQHFDQK